MKKTNFYDAHTELWYEADVVTERRDERDLDVYVLAGFPPARRNGIPTTSHVDPSRSGWSDMPREQESVPDLEPVEEVAPTEPPAESNDADDEEAVEFSSLTVAEAREQVDSESDVDVLDAWHDEELEGKNRSTLLSYIEARIDDIAEG